ncbi:maleate isomerase [Bosea sp. AK1]|uniref:maleate cis-trans isomerase family protein n=1 Tax=Bosea sp. AK1 TaxID=2587160 RepID=UPI00114DFC5D|nr:aspartate/glutamate racemase family protein [Bosea sp. AK1]TQI65349.1 maleate isomerase [Bosea sp. AK1]
MRVGLIIPSVNVVIEHDLRLFLPEEVRAHVTRIPLTSTSTSALQAALSAAPAAARLLADAGVSAVALACTGASMIAGEGGLTAAERLTQETSLPAIDTMGALFAAFSEVGARRIALVSPFGEAFNAAEAAVLNAGGVDVVAMAGFGMANPALCPDVDPEVIVERAAAIDNDRADAVFLSCANLRALEAVAPLEARLGKPVITSNQAVLWALLRLCSSTAVPKDGGRLFMSSLERCQ